MKRKFFSVLLLCLTAFCCSSCSTLGFLGIPSSRGWSSVSSHKAGTAELGTIRVDKNDGWDSVEDEARRLLPLLMAKKGYEAGNGAYRVDAVLIEREYMEGWKTRRSLSAEVYLFSDEGEVPLAAGKALLTGNKSLSSSKVLYALLNRALSRALAVLEKR